MILLLVCLCVLGGTIQFFQYFPNLHDLAKRSIPPPDSGLPDGAVEYNGELLKEFLAETKKSFITLGTHGNFPAITSQEIPGLNVIVSSHHTSFFNYQEHPVVQGCTWHRGYAVVFPRGTVVIFVHRIKIKRHEYPKTPLVYTVGTVSEKDIVSTVTLFFTHLQRKVHTEFSNNSYDKTMYFG